MNISLVSIVIPTYNREKYIAKAIESAMHQTYRNLEIIIGDNQSTDNTWAIIQEYASKDSRIKIFQNPTNIGPVMNWNACFERASGEYLKIIWSDDWISLNYIEHTLDLFDEDTAFVISCITIVDNEVNNKPTLYRKSVYSQKEYLDDIFLLHKENFPVSPGCAIFRRRDVLSSFIVNIKNTDGLDSTKNGAGNDLLLFLNIAVRYKYIKTSFAANSFFRSHPDSFTSSNKLDIYYSWSLISFLNHNSYKLYSDIFKYRFFVQSLKNKQYNNLYKYLQFSTSALFSFVIYVYITFRRILS